MNDEVLIKKIPPFPSRLLVIASANMLKPEGHDGFDAMRLEWDLLTTHAGQGATLAARATSLATYALQDPEIRTPEGISLQSAIVVRAGEIYRSGWMTNITERERTAFKSASLAAGSMNDVSESGIIDGPNNEEVYSPSLTQSKPRATMQMSNKVFLVHGRDNEAKNEVTLFLERIGLEVIILHERPNQGRHLLTKFQEEAGEVGFAVVLITPDDEGRLNGNGAAEPRARQNVIFELGFFIGKLGTSHVAPLVKGNVVRPSDFDGIGYINLDEAGGWKNQLARELSSARIPFKSEKVFTA